MYNRPTLDVFVALYEATRAVYKEEQACESPQHLTLPENHAGTAQWYVHVKHECGYNVVHALCDPVKQVLTAPLARATCSGCEQEVEASDVVRSYTRIGS